MRRCISCGCVVENHEITCGNCFIKKLKEDKKIIKTIPENIIKS